MRSSKLVIFSFTSEHNNLRCVVDDENCTVLSPISSEKFFFDTVMRVQSTTFDLSG